jgi:hypothetical protein
VIHVRKFCVSELGLWGLIVMPSPDLFQTDEQEPQEILRKMHRDPYSQGSLRIVSNWLANCVNNHDTCARTGSRSHTLPKRVLNVGGETTDPFLVETAAGNRLGRWAALSYCWGGEPSMKLTRGNTDELKRGIRLNSFDATIRDAILVTRALGLTYLWVDALCIFQDDDAQDWNEQSSEMHVIYGDSTLTIVAADSSSVKRGFLTERKLQYIALGPSPSGLGSEGSLDSSFAQRIHIAPSWDPKDDQITGPWTKRGWTMQEELLPNRLLYYTSKQTIWKCCDVIEYERGVIQEPRDEIVYTFMDDARGIDIWNFNTFSKFKALPMYLQLIPETSRSEKYRLWYAMVGDYSPRRFTNIQDRLVAISGLAKIFGDMIHDYEYVAGLWKRDLVRGLSWNVSGAKLTASKTTQDSSVPNDMIPSWSWASVGYDVVVNDHANQEIRSFVVIEDVQVDLVDRANPFGTVRGGSITITGPIFPLTRLYNKEWRCKETEMSALERYISNIVEEESLGEVEEKFTSSTGRFAVLKMLQPFPSLDRRLVVLILEATGGTSNGIAVHRRLGVLTFRYIHQSQMVSPKLLKSREAAKCSLRSRLGSNTPPRSEKLRKSKEVFKELDAQPWPTQTIIII